MTALPHRRSFFFRRCAAISIGCAWLFWGAPTLTAVEDNSAAEKNSPNIESSLEQPNTLPEPAGSLPSPAKPAAPQEIAPARETNSTADSGAARADAPAPRPAERLLPSLAITNVPVETAAKKPLTEKELAKFKSKLEMAQHLRASRQTGPAEQDLVELLGDDVPEAVQRTALVELATLAQDEHNSTRALQIYGQFLNRWHDDPRVPEILLRQGYIFRGLGLNTMALAKFYAVMTAALVLKNDQLNYYEHLVLEAQVEIAETHYLLGKYSEAAEFYTRLLKQHNPALDAAQVLFKLIRTKSSLTNYEEVVSYAQDFLERYPDAAEKPEVRFHLALALKQLGRSNESLQQVLTLLREEKTHTKDHPEMWAYWQQRTGNVIANQLYREGDFMKALDIYLNLAQLDDSPSWQLAVWYQIGITYEKLLQPQKATEIYNNILAREKTIGADAPPSVKALFDMARWRIGFIDWQNKADAVNRSLSLTNQTAAPFTASLGATNNASPP